MFSFNQAKKIFKSYEFFLYENKKLIIENTLFELEMKVKVFYWLIIENKPNFFDIKVDDQRFWQKILL